MEKPNGHLNMLDLTFYFHYDVMKIIVDNFKNNINALDLLCNDLNSEDESYLLHENLRLRFLEKLTVGAENKIVLNLLKKHAEQLTYLNLYCSHFELYLQNFPKFDRLETLVVDQISYNTLAALLSSCSESLSKLKIKDMYEEEHLEAPQVPKLKLQSLALCDGGVGETEKSLFSNSRQTLTGISFENYQFNMLNTYFTKVKYLKFKHDIWCKYEIEDLISTLAFQLETLILVDVVDLSLPNQLPMMKNAWIKNCDTVPNLLKRTPSLQCLVLEDFSGSHLKGIAKMPKLTDLYLLTFDYHGNSFVENSISELFVSIADTLEFLVIVHPFSDIKCKSMDRISVELKKVHTLIVLHENPLASDTEIFKSLCPNAHIMTTESGREYVIEALKSRLKYLKADTIFSDHLYDLSYLFRCFS